MIQGILFDFDGTLTKPGTIDFISLKTQIGCPNSITVLEYINTAEHSEKKDYFNRILEEEELKAAAISQPNHKAESCMKFFKTLGIKLGIHTRNTDKSLTIALSNFSYVNKNDFTAIITREHAPPKPDPAGVFMAARQMGIDNMSSMLVVGDNPFDIDSGKKAGAQTAFITNGKNITCEFADYVIKSLTDIISIINSNQKH